MQGYFIISASLTSSFREMKYEGSRETDLLEKTKRLMYA